MHSAVVNIAFANYGISYIFVSLTKKVLYVINYLLNSFLCYYKIIFFCYLVFEKYSFFDWTWLSAYAVFIFHLSAVDLLCRLLTWIHNSSSGRFFVSCKTIVNRLQPCSLFDYKKVWWKNEWKWSTPYNVIRST